MEDIKDWLRVWFKRSKKVLIHPKEFYSKDIEEKSTEYLIKFGFTTLFALYLINCIGAIILYLIYGNITGNIEPFGIFYLQELGKSLYGFITGIPVLLFYCFVYHAILYIFFKKRGFKKTLEPFIYSFTPGIFLFIPVLNIFALLYSFYLFAKGLEKIHDLKFYKAVIVIAVPWVIYIIVIILLIIGAAWALSGLYF